MCGIAGLYNFISQKPVAPGIIHRICEKLIHRGPDDYGVYINGPIGLGHRRLTIIDLSSNAKQPMSNEDGSIWIVFNGEIYNFQEIRNELIKRGHLFKTKSDTEVIIHAYEEYGEECLNKFIGMFAFALWDNKKKRLFLARDRVGKKPLIYHVGRDFFIFASEIKAILEHERVPREVNFEALDYYFAFGYIPSPFTIFKNIKKLKPGHYLIIQNGNIIIKQYWNPYKYSPKLQIKNKKNIIAQIKELLKDSIRLRMVSDVPIGAFLSGGMDSSLMVAFIASINKQPIQTFTIGFKEDKYNEIPFAKIIANQFKTIHRDFVLKPNIIEILPILIEAYSEPFGDSSAIPTYYVSKMASNYVKVALSGDGGDELFAGYNRYSSLYKLKIYDAIPRSLANIIKHFIHQEPENYWLYDNMSLLEKIKYALNVRMLTTAERNFYFSCITNHLFRNSLFSKEIRKILNQNNFAMKLFFEHFNEIPFSDVLAKVFALDVILYLPEDLLVKVDIASMANSLEVRCPLLDHRIVEFALGIPLQMKISLKSKKIILKEIACEMLPNPILKRPKKGFSVPLKEWFRTDLKHVISSIIKENASEIKSFFNLKFVKQIISIHQNGIADYSRIIWLLLNFVLWYKYFIKNESISL